MKKITVLLLALTSLLWAKEVAFSFDDGVNPENNPLAEQNNSCGMVEQGI